MCACAEYAACWFVIEDPQRRSLVCFFLLHHVPRGFSSPRNQGPSLSWGRFSRDNQGISAGGAAREPAGAPTHCRRPAATTSQRGWYCYTPRIPNGSRGGKPSPWSLLLRYLVGSAGQITSGRICLSDQVNLSNNYIMFTF